MMITVLYYFVPRDH